MDSSGKQEGNFSLQRKYYKTRQIKFYEGDFVCVRVKEEMYMGRSNLGTSERKKSEMDSDLESEVQVTMTQLEANRSLASNSSYGPRSQSSSIWLGHGIVGEVKFAQDSEIGSVKITLCQSASEFPKELLKGGSLSTLTVIHRPPLHRRMSAVLRKGLKNAPERVKAICLGHELSQGDFELPPFSDLSISRKDSRCQLEPLNDCQNEAVKVALGKPFSLIQGPPGTGKTVTGAHIAYWFAHQNKINFSQSEQKLVESDGSSSQVIYCGPSNKSVDVVAKKLLQIPELKIIRVYSDLREQAEFPLPNKRKPLRSSSDDDETQELDEKLKEVALHHVIRADTCPFAHELKEYERKFKQDKKKGVRTEDAHVDSYRDLIEQAEKWAFQSNGVQIILCTCAVAAKSSIIKSCEENIKQCIVDECGMCLELESLLPIAFLAPQQVVLIGDHKQLQPIIHDKKAQNLGLNVSMFERLSGKAKMLRLQYRMHEEICKFPSEHFYNNQLETDASVKNQGTHLQSFWPVENVPMAFCHVMGEEEVTPIKTALSNEQSKANDKEVRKAVHVANCLVNNYRVSSSKIVILSPYREQQERIRKELAKTPQCKDILVTTIAKSQGSEWDYVILSLVRSLSGDEHCPEGSSHWVREHLGFLEDDHLMNVGLTRARKGLCIIGNKNLLSYNSMWKNLIESFEKRHCVVNETDWPKK
ncbi:helicase with zinc finger domain 2-like [Stylophora pistillata]|nr:helicase with zinc finger domain 2-like [Stylophora pistillata]